MKIDKEILNQYIGLSNGPRTLKYTWRDVALYALGVGAQQKDLEYVYEGTDMKVLPTFALVPYINAVNLAPRRRLPSHPANLVRDQLALLLEDESLSPLHMSMEMTMHGKINPLEGTFLCEDRVAGIYDRGEGKGIAVQTEMEIYDNGGNHVSTLKGVHMINACGGFGGEKLPSQKVQYPDREADYQTTEKMSETQHMLYRLSGDLNKVHVDPEAAKKRGFSGAFMQGLCSCGYACRMATDWISPGDPERVKYFYAQMRSICYPGETLRFDGWKEEKEDKITVNFRLINKDGKAVLDNGTIIFTKEEKE